MAKTKQKWSSISFQTATSEWMEGEWQQCSAEQNRRRKWEEWKRVRRCREREAEPHWGALTDRRRCALQNKHWSAVICLSHEDQNKPPVNQSANLKSDLINLFKSSPLVKTVCVRLLYCNNLQTLTTVFCLSLGIRKSTVEIKSRGVGGAWIKTISQYLPKVGGSRIK